MTAVFHVPPRAEHKFLVSLTAFAFSASFLTAETPKLNVRAKNGWPREEQRKKQMLRLAKEYDLRKYTITRDIIMERRAINHSSPILMLNLRFVDHMERRNGTENPRLFEDFPRTPPSLDYGVPGGDGQPKLGYFQIAACMLKWQAMEEFVGPEGTRKVLEWKPPDHYKAIYALLLDHREQVESVLNRNGVRW